MEGNIESYTTLFGFILFILFFLGLVGYALTRSWRRSVQVGLDSVRVKLRLLHTRLGEFRAGFQLFSPGDPEPFGPLVEAALDRLVGAELVLRGLFDRYSGLHEDISKLRSSRDWNFLRFPGLWYKKRSDLVNLASDIVKFEPSINELLNYQDRLAQLNSDVAKNSQAILQKSNAISSALEKLHQSGLGGQVLDRAREDVRNWQTTILSQVPVIFFSNDSAVIRSQVDKETTARVYRLNQAAEPAVAQLLSQAEQWKQWHQEYLENSEKIKTGIPDIQKIIEELSRSPVFPVLWGPTTLHLEELTKSLGELEVLFATHDVDNLSDLSKKSTVLFKEMIAISENLADVRSDHMELIGLSLSEEMMNGTETLKAAYKLLGTIGSYSPGNFLVGDAVGALDADLKGIASLQGRFLRYQTGAEVHENEIHRRLELARGLSMQYRSISPRLQSIRKRFKDIGEWELSALKKLDELQRVATTLEAMVEENKHLRKSIGTEPAKVKNQVGLLSVELSQKDKDTVEKKLERCQSLYSRLLKDLEKWSDALSGEIDRSHNELAEQIGLLREIAWIDDPVMAESEQLLSKVVSNNTPGESDSVNKEDLLKRLDSFVISNDVYLRHANILQRISLVAGPILTNYRQAEKSHDAVARMIGKLGEMFPENEETWPPTTIRLGSEQARAAQLEKEWSALKKERMKASILVERLSRLLSEYKSVEAQLEDGIGRARQEQNRFGDYEKRLEDSRRMWKKVAANHPNNRVVGDGVELLLSGVDQEVQRLRARYSRGDLNYSLALQAMRQICRKLDEAVVEIDRTQIIDINGEIQRRL